MSELNSPKSQDLVLGGQAPLTSSMVLGGVAGLHQRLANAPTGQKAELLLQILDYGEAGIDLLVEASQSSELVVRATACELLQLTNSPKTSALASGFPLYPGDRLFFVYEAVLSYNDNDYSVYTSLESIDYYLDLAPEPVSCHLRRPDAELAAQKLHLHRAKDLSDLYLPIYFNLQQWCAEHFILRRHPEENAWDYAERLRQIFEKFERQDLLTQLWQAIEQPDADIDQWFDTHPILPPESLAIDFYDLENLDENYWRHQNWDRQFSEFRTQMLHWLQGNESHELLGQLWQDTLGQLAFVHEEVITETKYLDLNQFNQLNLFS
jgi:hypothetical protein